MIEQLKIFGDEGQEIILDGFDFNPLSFDELKSAFEGHDTVQIRINRARVQDVTTGQIFWGRDISMRWRPPLTIGPVALVRGGWMPSSLGLSPNTIIFADRNFISAIVERHRRISRVKQDYMDAIFESDPIFDATLFALEGNERRFPEFDQFRQQSSEAIAKIRDCFPEAKVRKYSIAQERLIYREFARLSSLASKQEKFLCAIAPTVASQTKLDLLPQTWSMVLDKAIEHDIDPKSMLVLAVLSAVATTKGASIARRVFKFSKNYSKEAAYNALADFRALDLAALGLHHQGDFEGRVITADKNLALLWSGLRVRPSQDTPEPSYTTTPCAELFPARGAMDLLETMLRTNFGNFATDVAAQHTIS